MGIPRITVAALKASAHCSLLIALIEAESKAMARLGVIEKGGIRPDEAGGVQAGQVKGSYLC